MFFCEECHHVNVSQIRSSQTYQCGQLKELRHCPISLHAI